MLYLRNKEKKTPYLFMLPSILIILGIFLYPVAKVIWDSLFQINGAMRKFVGLNNFFVLFSDSLFWTSVVNNLKLFLSVPVLVVLSLIFAVILFYRIPGWRIYRVLLLVPFILSITVVGIVFDYLLREDGLVNLILSKVGMEPFAWLGTEATAMYSIMGAVIWKELGFGIVLFLARLHSVDESVLEAAKLDGAGVFSTTWRILLPELKSVLSFYIIFCLINMLSWMFNYVFVMTRGGPKNSTYIIEYYIYQLGIRYRQYGFAAALSVILLVFAMILVVIQSRINKQLKEDEEV